MREKLVAHLKDGMILKGHSRDFDPREESFHLFNLGFPVASAQRVDLDSLKGLFFVRSWGRPPGQVTRRYRFTLSGGPPTGQRAFVRFHDGERMWGYVPPDSHLERGFYFIPADPDDNNIKVFVVRSSVDEMQLLEELSSVHH